MKIFNINSYYSYASFYHFFHEALRSLGCEIFTYVFAKKKCMISHDKIENYTKVEYCFNEADRYLFYFKHYKAFLRLQKYEKELISSDIIHAHSLFSNGYLAYRAKKKYGTPYIVAVRSSDVTCFFKYRPLLRPLAIKIMKSASHIVFISANYKDIVVDKYIPQKDKELLLPKMVVLPNGVDPFWLNHLWHSRILGNRTVKLFYAGQITRRKRIGDVSKAVEILNKEGLSVTLSFAGEIVDEKLFSKVCSNKYSTYLGELNKEQLMNAYRMHDILILTSIRETFGIVYAEALTQGMPVIYSKNEGFDGYFGNGVVGFAAESGVVYDICRAIKSAIREYDQLSKNCINSAQAFSWEHISRQYCELYARTIDE